MDVFFLGTITVTIVRWIYGAGKGEKTRPFELQVVQSLIALALTLGHIIMVIYAKQRAVQNLDGRQSPNLSKLQARAKQLRVVIESLGLNPFGQNVKVR